MTAKENSFIENFSEQELKMMDLSHQNLGNRSEFELVTQNLSHEQTTNHIF